MNRPGLGLVLWLAATSFARAEDEISTTFSYDDSGAQSVSVAGEFSNWEGLPMTNDGAGNWSRTVPLKPGHYGYKFIVNGTDWVFDPKNPLRKRVGDADNSALFVGTKGEVAFAYFDTTANTVHLAGDFNNWLDNVGGKVTGKTEWLMQGDGSGNWKHSMQLPAGSYKYKFVIDGERWEKDPKAPASDDDNSILEVKANAAPATESAAVTFRYADSSAESVSVAGDFNQWNKSAHSMTKDESGVWTTTVSLKPGRHPYKFYVDGSWKQDPDNAEAVPDGVGGSNSVKVVTQ